MAASRWQEHISVQEAEVKGFWKGHYWFSLLPNTSIFYLGYTGWIPNIS